MKKERAEDLEIARSVYRKFDSFRQLKDDLIQEALIKLWEFRNNEKKFFTFAGARKVAKDAMIDFLRKEHNHLDYDVSIFEPIDNTTDKTYMDILSDDVIDDERREQIKRIEKLKYGLARDAVVRALKRFNFEERKIIRLLVQGHTYRAIEQKIGASKSYVGNLAKRFKSAVARELTIFGGLNTEYKEYKKWV